MSIRKYSVVDNYTGEKYEVTEHTDELGYIHKQPEQKPVSFKDIERLYKKEFPESQSQPVNEVLRLRKLIDNAKTI